MRVLRKVSDKEEDRALPMIQYSDNRDPLLQGKKIKFHTGWTFVP